jgi:hypothetical protein
MERHETPLERARRHAARCEELIGAQERLIERLRLDLHPTLDAEELLSALRQTLVVMRQHVAIEEQRVGGL